MRDNIRESFRLEKNKTRFFIKESKRKRKKNVLCSFRFF